MPEITQAPSKQDVKTDEPKKTEAPLEEKQLEQVTGGTGSLTQASTTGKHFPTATINP